MSRTRLNLVPISIEGETGLDIVIEGEAATVTDLLLAMQEPADDPEIFKPLHRSRYGVCAGCTYNCCKSNDIPLDLVAAKGIAGGLGQDLEQFAKRYLRLDHTVSYPEFKQRPCPFLENNLCTVYAVRALICRLYLCTPMSERLEKLRNHVLLMGNSALRQRLVELKLAPRRWAEKHLRPHTDDVILLDMLLHRNPYLLDLQHDEVRLKDCCPPSFWATLIK